MELLKGFGADLLIEEEHRRRAHLWARWSSLFVGPVTDGSIKHLGSVVVVRTVLIYHVAKFARKIEESDGR